MIKKYYLISEVQKILSVPTYKLRYLEKVTDKLNIFKIKGRRYYTTKDIEYLKNYFSQDDLISAECLDNNRAVKRRELSYSDIFSRIDGLIHKFQNLAKEVDARY